MAPDHDADDVLSAPERRLVEVLGDLAGETFVAHAGLSANVLRRARRQQETRAALVVGSSLLAALVTGLAGLLPSSDAWDDRR
jgi:hypothetical protein